MPFCSLSSWWSVQLRTDLRLLLDECLQVELAEAIRHHKAIDAEWVNESTVLPSSSDESLMEVAKAGNRILVTVEGRINEKRFKICTHPGIIVFRAKRQHDAIRAEIFRSFVLSGCRSRARKAVTYLKMEGVSFRELREDGTIGETSLRWNNIKQHPHRERTNYCDFGGSV